MEIYSSAFPNLLFNFVQYRDRPDFIGAVCFLPGYPVFMDGILTTAHVHVGYFLWHNPISGAGTEAILFESNICFYYLFSDGGY